MCTRDLLWSSVQKTNHRGGEEFLCLRPLAQSLQVPESLSQEWQRLQHNGLFVVFSCVGASSRKTYNSGIKRWFVYCARFGFDPFLRVVPVGWRAESALFGFREASIVGFISLLFFGEGGRGERGLAPKTINTYISGIRYMFKTVDTDIGFLSSSSVKSARTGIVLHHSLTNPVARKRKLPDTIGFIQHAFEVTFASSEPEDVVVCVAMLLAFVCLFRASEYLGKYFVRGKDIAFEIRCLSAHDTTLIAASDPSLLLCRKDFVVGVIINNRGGKMDTRGEGNRFHFPRQARSSSVAFDVVEVLFSWACLVQMQPNEPFLSYRSQWKLSYKFFSIAIKRVAGELGLDSSRFTILSFVLEVPLPRLRRGFQITSFRNLGDGSR